LIIDTHTHLLDFGHWPTEWWDWVAADWASQRQGRTPSAVRARIEQGLVDPDGTRMVARMDAARVDKSVLLPIDWGPTFTGTIPITQVVDKALELAAVHGDRLIPFAGIDPRRPDAVELVSNWFERGALGLKLYPSCGWDPRDESAMAIYEV
jgi:predicted TIM-barrel fold metal-dependent hydrolase